MKNSRMRYLTACPFTLWTMAVAAPVSKGLPIAEMIRQGSEPHWYIKTALVPSPGSIRRERFQ